MEEYLNILLEQIRCRKAKPAIEKEMRDHIEDEAAVLAAGGMEETEALKTAIKEMGDPIEVGISLDAVHRPRPAYEIIGLIAFLSALSFGLHCVIGLDNGELGGHYILTSALERIVGFAVMMLVYLLDYSILAKFAKPAALIFLGFACLFFFFGHTVNGSLLFIHGASFSLSFYMALYIPLFAGVLYQYHGSGLFGLIKSVLWMLLPCIMVFRIPNPLAAAQLFIVMGVMLTIAVWKHWFHIKRVAFTAAFWSAALLLPSALLALTWKFQWLGEYQQQRLAAFISGKERAFSYIGNNIQKILEDSYFWGGQHVNLADWIPAYNQDYILVFLASYYGILALVAIVAVLAFASWKFFAASVRQKNQLGLMMGCGCAIYFVSAIVISLLEIWGALPVAITWLPFFSSGFSCTLVSYAMAGIVLSVYRYKDVLPAMPKRVSFLRLTRNFSKFLVR